jgi:hypothetical protein
MSANTSTTAFEDPRDLNTVDILEKIESQRAVGEYSPASSIHRSPSVTENKLEEGTAPSSDANAPITHRPTGVKVFPPFLKPF